MTGKGHHKSSDSVEYSWATHCFETCEMSGFPPYRMTFPGGATRPIFLSLNPK